MSKQKPFLKRLWKSVWLFPSMLFVLLTLLTAFQISGTSAGIYYPVLYGDKKNPDLLFNKPLPVRSDEWLVTTQLTIAQHEAGYTRVNPNIDGGSDMSVVGDAPYKDWSAAFRPQNLIFFVLPLAYAFAFKWWLLLFLVIVSCYFFVLRFFPGKRLLAALIGGAVGCSPFLFWWYSTGTMAPIFYGFLIMLVGIRIINDEPARIFRKYPQTWSRAVYAMTLSYLLTAFAFVLYPPFQIPVALTVAAFLVGYLIERCGFNIINLLKRLPLFIISMALALAIVGAFVGTRSQAVSAIQHSDYPGVQHIKAGGTPTFKVFSTFLQPQLERHDRSYHYYDNPSEASNFFLLLPFLLIPGFMCLYYEYRKSGKFRWSLLSIQLVGCLFLADLFLGGPQIIYNLFFLQKVAHSRLLIGLGFVGVIQLLLVMKSLEVARPKRRYIWATIYSLLCFIVLVYDAGYVQKHWPLFISNSVFVILLAATFAGIIFMFLSRRFLMGAVLFFTLSVLSVTWVHPLYRGIKPLYPSKLSSAINSASKPGDSWVTLDDVYFENAASMAGRKSLSGIQPYPNLKLWGQVEKSPSNYIYNRYAHILFSSDQSATHSIRLARPDNFHVKFTCNSFIEQHVQYALSSHPVDIGCVHLVDRVRYPSMTFYIYKVD